jgi:hypothetical protein
MLAFAVLGCVCVFSEKANDGYAPLDGTAGGVACLIVPVLIVKHIEINFAYAVLLGAVAPGRFTRLKITHVHALLQKPRPAHATVAKPRHCRPGRLRDAAPSRST